MLRNPFAPRTIRGTLIALIAIALAPLVAFGVYTVADEYEHQRNLEVRASAELARAVAAAVDGFVQSVLRTQHAVGASVAVHGVTPQELEEELSRVNAEFPMSLDMSWLEPGGIVAASTEPRLVGKSMFARDYYQDIVRGAEWKVTPLMHSLLDGGPVFIIARAVRGAGGQLAGIVTSAIDGNKLGALLGERSGGGVIAIIDSGGTTVARQPAADLDWSARGSARDHPHVQKALAGTEAAGVYNWPPGQQRRIGALVPIPSLGWAVHASRPIDSAMAPVRRAAVYNGTVLLLVALSALGAALVVARKIAGPLTALERHAARLATEGPSAAPRRGPVEVRRVARALDSMAVSLAKRHADLEAMNRRLSEKEERFRLLAAAAEARKDEIEAVIAALPIGFAVAGHDGRSVRVNEPAREMLGATPEDVSGSLEEIGARFRISRPDGHVLGASELPLSRALRGEVIRSEMLRVERKGAVAPLWIASSTAPIRDSSGAVQGAVAVFLDVTQLRELQEERETLMQTVSHDLRTPLHVIVGHAEILRRRGDDETRRRSLAILASAGRMTRLIGDLVDAARLEAGHVALRLEPIDLVTFLAGWRDRMAGALAMERVRISAPPSVPVVLADAGRLDQILVNLVSNALKYSVADSDVRVELTATASALRLSVADRGPGIAPEELPRLFERYYRTKSAARAEGLGLGLFITRKLVEAHGWRIEVASEQGSGSVFTLVLPIASGKTAHATAA